MDSKDGQRDLEEKPAQSIRAAQRLRKIRAFTKAGRVRKLTAALRDDDDFLPLLAAEELAKTGRVDAVAGILTALENERLAGAAIKGILSVIEQPGAAEPGYRDRLLTGVMVLRVSVWTRRKQLLMVSEALAKAPGRRAVEMFVAHGEAQSHDFRLPTLLNNINEYWLHMMDIDRVSAAEALLPHLDNLRAVETFAALLQRFHSIPGTRLPASLAEAAEAEQLRDTLADPAFAGMPQTLRRIAQSGQDHWDMISVLHQALDDRIARKGIYVGFNENREFELHHLTRPEWIIRTLNCFLCCCENCGSLHGQAEMGIPLAEFFDEVGIAGCARALRAIEGVMKEEEARAAGSVPEDELYGDAYDARLQAVEREAEGMEECCRLLWQFALQHKDEVLRDG